METIYHDEMMVNIMMKDDDGTCNNEMRVVKLMNDDDEIFITRTTSTSLTPFVNFATSVARLIDSCTDFGFNFQFPPINGFLPLASIDKLEYLLPDIDDDCHALTHE